MDNDLTRMTRLEWLKMNRKEDIEELREKLGGNMINDNTIVIYFCPDNHGVPGSVGCSETDCVKCWNIDVME